MSIITRAKNILLSPKTEWGVIGGETETPQSLLGKYVIPMALIPAIAQFIGFGLIGFDSVFFRFGGVKWGLILGLIRFITSIVSYFVCTYVVDALAPSFGSAKNLGRSAQLVAYSFTAAWVAGIFYILPALGILAILGLYSIYLFYLGIPVMKGTPEDKQITYMIVCAVVIVVVLYVINLLLTTLIYSIVGNPFLPVGSGLDMHWR